MRRQFILATTAIALFSGTAFAQTATPPATTPTHGHTAMKERFKNATPEQKAKMKTYGEKFKNATPEQQAKMKAHQERFKNATPEQKAKMKTYGEKFKNATPEQREQMRKQHHEGKVGGKPAAL